MSLKPEEIIQINVINWFNYQYPEFEKDLHHFANERYLDIKKNPKLWATGRKLGRMGVTAGVSDLHLAIPTNSYPGLWLELKTEDGRLSKEQKEFLDQKSKRGYLALAVWGETAAKEVLKNYLKHYESNSDGNELKKLFEKRPIC